MFTKILTFLWSAKRQIGKAINKRMTATKIRGK